MYTLIHTHIHLHTCHKHDMYTHRPHYQGKERCGGGIWSWADLALGGADPWEGVQEGFLEEVA